MKKKPLLFSVIVHLVLILTALFIVVNHSMQNPNWVFVEFGSFSNSSKKENGELNNKSNKTENFPTAKNKGEGDYFSEYKTDKDSIVSDKLETDSALAKYGNGKFEIDFQGKRERTIYSYTIPTYPAGAEKEVDLVFQVTIAPDGTVENVFPLTKGDARLEVASINALNKWRFEPLPKSMPQINQKVVVVFPYRLR